MLISQRSQQDSGEQREKFNPWSAYSDMYCSLLLIFMLLFFFAILNYLEAQDKNVEATERIQNELTVTRSEQEDLTRELNTAREKAAFYEEAYAARDAEQASLRLELNDRTKELEDARLEAQTLSAQVQSLQDALYLANEFLSEEQQRAARLEDDAGAKIAALQEQLADRDRVIEDLRGQLQRAAAASDTMTARIDELTAESARLASALQEAEANANSLTARNDELTAESARLTSALREAETNAGRLTARIAELSGEYIRMDSDLQEAVADVARLTERIVELSGENARMVSTLQETDARVSQLTARNAELTARNAELTAENGRLTSALQEAEANAGRLTARDNEFSGEYDRLTSALQEVEDNAARLAARNAELTAENARLAVALQEAEANKGRLTARNDELSGENARLTSDLQEEEADVARLTERIVELSGENARMIATLREAEEKAKAFRAEANSAAESSRAMSAQITSLEARIAELEAEALNMPPARAGTAAEMTGEIMDRLTRGLRDAGVKYDLSSSGNSFVFRADELFNSGWTELNSAGRSRMEEFFPVFIQLLLNDPEAESIRSVSFIGYERNADSYSGKMRLAVNRAVNTARYCYEQIETNGRLREALSVGGHVMESGEVSPSDSDSFVEVVFTLWYNQ